MNTEWITLAIAELRYLTRCSCEVPYPLASGRHDPDCCHAWREDVETVAAALGLPTGETQT